MKTDDLISRLAEIEGALDSETAFTAEARKLGAADSEIEAAIDQLGGFPIDDDLLTEVSGGYAIHAPIRQNAPGRQSPWS